MPDWVLIYVVRRELAHWEKAKHGARFWRLATQYSSAERARGCLMGVGLEEDGAV